MVTAAMLVVIAYRLRYCLWFIARAAAIVIVTSPDVDVGPSFQLMFAVAARIVAAYEAQVAGRQQETESSPPGRGISRSVRRHCSEIAGLSLIVTAATAPLLQEHFR